MGVVIPGLYPCKRRTRRAVRGSPQAVASGGSLGSGCLSALATSRLLLSGRSSLGRVAARAGLLAATARGLRRVGDLGRPLLRHALVLEGLVLLLVLDVRSCPWHHAPPFVRALYPRPWGRSAERAARSLRRPWRPHVP